MKMWKENTVFCEDLENLCRSACIPWDSFHGKTVFITGGTGLIGHTAASALLYYSMTRDCPLRVLLLVRSRNEAAARYAAQINDGCDIDFIEGTVEELPAIAGHIDYIIHGACPTASGYFLSHPAETARTILLGTANLLSLAAEKRVSGMVFLSSMEVYGQVSERRELPEDDLGTVDISLPRSVYPEGKRMAENLCCAWAAEYGVPVAIVRLAQTFGPGVKRDDQRVFAYMARCALDGEDIRLATAGDKENMYLYTADAVSAILLLLARGERGTAYNAGNPDTYCSVREMAELTARTIGNGEISVRTNTGGQTAAFRPDGYLKLDVSRISALGWRAGTSLGEMFRRMAACFDK